MNILLYTFKGHGTVETVVGSDLILPGILKHRYCSRIVPSMIHKVHISSFMQNPKWNMI